MNVARLIVSGNTCAAFVHYDYRRIPKSMPGSRWDRSRRAWIVPVELLDALADALRAAGLTVYLDGGPWTTPGPHGSKGTPATDWIAAAFRAVPPDNADRLRAGLLRAFHPDRGGSVQLAQQINEAADQHTRRRKP